VFIYILIPPGLGNSVPSHHITSTIHLVIPEVEVMLQLTLHTINNDIRLLAIAQLPTVCAHFGICYCSKMTDKLVYRYYIAVAIHFKAYSNSNSRKICRVRCRKGQNNPLSLNNKIGLQG
jgi:hypothetical protein